MSLFFSEATANRTHYLCYNSIYEGSDSSISLKTHSTNSLWWPQGKWLCLWTSQTEFGLLCNSQQWFIFLKRYDFTSCVSWKLFFQTNCYWFWAKGFAHALSRSVSTSCTDVNMYYIRSETASRGDLNAVTHLKCIPPQKPRAPTVPVYYFSKCAIIKNNNSFSFYSCV